MGLTRQRAQAANNAARRKTGRKDKLIFQVVWRYKHARLKKQIAEAAATHAITRSGQTDVLKKQAKQQEIIPFMFALLLLYGLYYIWRNPTGCCAVVFHAST